MKGNPYCLIRSAMTSDCQPNGATPASSLAAAGLSSTFSCIVIRFLPSAKIEAAWIRRTLYCLSVLFQRLLQEGDTFWRLVERVPDSLGNLVADERIERKAQLVRLCDERR